MTIWTRAFWVDTLERAIKTFAQAALAVLTAAGVGLLDADWTGVLSAAGMAALAAVLTAVAGSGRRPGESAVGDAESP